MKLSDRIRPNVEAAPWVIEAIKNLEEELSENECVINVWRRRTLEAETHCADLREALRRIGPRTVNGNELMCPLCHHYWKETDMQRHAVDCLATQVDK